ncbi:hypothetical protein K438DRAFT_1812261 [Mycena galopus ATCC 62051]|nr:hypothetical protein K438DRAFT_1812261 [Mycena galopus ATCC 62051]
MAAGALGWRAPEVLCGDVRLDGMGCLFFTLTNGGHPFGDPFDREANILKGAL